MENVTSSSVFVAFVLVAVADGKTGECFEIEVREREKALDVFHHPYACAAWRGIDTRSATAEPNRLLAAY